MVYTYGKCKNSLVWEDWRTAVLHAVILFLSYLYLLDSVIKILPTTLWTLFWRFPHSSENHHDAYVKRLLQSSIFLKKSVLIHAFTGTWFITRNSRILRKSIYYQKIKYAWSCINFKTALKSFMIAYAKLVFFPIRFLPPCTFQELVSSK